MYYFIEYFNPIWGCMGKGTQQKCLANPLAVTPCGWEAAESSTHNASEYLIGSKFWLR